MAVPQKDELAELTPDSALLVDDPREVQVAVGVIRGLVDMVASTGVDRQRFVQAAGLSAEQLNASDLRLPYLQASRILELALDITGDDMLGLRWARALTERTFVPMSHLVSHTTSLAESFRLLARYYYLLTNRRSFELIANGAVVTLRYVPLADESERLRRFAADMTIASFFRFVWSFNPRMRPGPARFSHLPTAQAQRKVYERIFCGEVHFGSDFSGFEFDRELLMLPSPQRDDEVRDAMRELMEHRLLRVTHSARWVARVRERLMGCRPGEVTDMTRIARSLQVSVRTLRRRLADEGYTYDRILEEARRDAAMRLLQTPGQSIQEVAYHLGFSSANAFHRAFKRWTGMTPKTYHELRLRAQT